MSNRISLKTFAKRLKQLREERHLTQDELAVNVNLKKSTLSKYENELREPRLSNVEKIADFFDVSVNWLMGYSDIRDKNIDSGNLVDIFDKLSDHHKHELFNYATYLKHKAKDPKYVLGQTAAGQPTEYVDSFMDEAEGAPGNADYGLTVKGDSMEPLIKNGSTVWVHDQLDVENGEIAIIEIDQAVTCKKVYKRDNCLELQSLNPKYKPMIVGTGEVRIIGKVIL
jgi:repressor LexA